jgi:hypothetical protein
MPAAPTTRIFKAFSSMPAFIRRDHCGAVLSMPQNKTAPTKVSAAAWDQTDEIS